MVIARHRRAAIVGTGVTSLQAHPEATITSLAASAAHSAVDAAGVAWSDIDGLIACRSPDGVGDDTEIGAQLGLNPAFSATLTYGTCNFSVHLAAMALASGMANTVLLTFATRARSDRRSFQRTGLDDEWAKLQGYVHIAGPAAMAFRRHQAIYGTTERQLGQIAVGQREFAQLNPLATFTDALDIDGYLDSPYLVEPLRRHDVTMRSDGGVAIVITTKERSAELKRSPVHVLGMGQQSALGNVGAADNLMRTWLSSVADRTYADAGVNAADIDLLYVQDPTSVWTLQALEGFGFCPVGEAGPYLQEGHARRGGRLPVNTHGGQLSESYMWGWTHLVELDAQLRQAAGDRQCGQPSLAIYCSTMAFQKGAATVFAAD